MSIHIKDYNSCCGCTACVSICKHGAISMLSDNLGFLYPQVNNSLCVECGLCETVCQFHDNYKRYENYSKPIAYSLRLKDNLQLMRSQSGGAFYGIAKYILSIGGVIYGASFNEQWKVVHQRASNLEELEKLRMSKYVQSDLRGVFQKINNDLRHGFIVLFTGTACQVAGLKAYIPIKLHKTLFCVDIICHGVPSPQIWEDYILYLESHYQSKIVKACFRDKRFGWYGAKETFSFKNSKEIVRQTFNRLYFSGLSIRESCSNCKFTNINRVGDLTIGDHWGISKKSPFVKDAKGVSILLVNSDKGNQILHFINSNFIAELVDINECMQPQLRYPTKLSVLHENFVNDYCTKGFYYVAKKYGDIGWKFYIRKFINNFKMSICRIIWALHIKKKPQRL